MIHSQEKINLQTHISAKRIEEITLYDLRVVPLNEFE